MALTKVNLANTVEGTLPAANGGTGVTSFPSPGTSGNVLTSNGTAWTSAAAAAFDSGTVMIFGQTTAPTGWTKDTTNYNNYALVFGWSAATLARLAATIVASSITFASSHLVIAVIAHSGSEVIG